MSEDVPSLPPRRRSITNLQPGDRLRSPLSPIGENEVTLHGVPTPGETLEMSSGSLRVPHSAHMVRSVDDTGTITGMIPVIGEASSTVPVGPTPPGSQPLLVTGSQPVVPATPQIPVSNPEPQEVQVRTQNPVLAPLPGRNGGPDTSIASPLQPPASRPHGVAPGFNPNMGGYPPQMPIPGYGPRPAMPPGGPTPYRYNPVPPGYPLPPGYRPPMWPPNAPYRPPVPGYAYPPMAQASGWPPAYPPGAAHPFMPGLNPMSSGSTMVLPSRRARRETPEQAKARQLESLREAELAAQEAQLQAREAELEAMLMKSLEGEDLEDFYYDEELDDYEYDWDEDESITERLIRRAGRFGESMLMFTQALRWALIVLVTVIIAGLLVWALDRSAQTTDFAASETGGTVVNSQSGPNNQDYYV